MLEHEPWILHPDYETGINGQRICIIGYSHHRSERDFDSEDFTRWVVGQHIKGELGRNSFFPHIQGYFDSAAAGFWNRVMFFNFLPDAIGITERRYAVGSADQVNRGGKRFLRLVDEHKPHRVFVFTTKGWHDLGPIIEKESGKKISSLGDEFPKFSWGTYSTGNHIIMAFGLRHPQYASGTHLKAAVKQILDIPLAKKVHN